MCENAASLPDDRALCHEIIRQQAETIQGAQRRIEQLEHQIEQLLRRQFGPRRERVDPNQLRLFTEDGTEEVAEVTPEEPPGSDVAKPRRHWRRKGRQRLPEDLPRKRVEYELSPEELPCPDCGRLRVKIGEETSEQLEYVPSSLHVLVHARFRYACRACLEHVAIADKPPQPIERGCPARGCWPRRSRASTAITSRSTGSRTSLPVTGSSCRGPRSAAGWPPVQNCSRRSTT